MAKVTFSKFSGIAPRVSPNKLSLEMAQVATNVRLLAGTLSSWANTLLVKTSLTAAATSTIYRYGRDLVSDSNYWFHWTADVDVVKGAISGDETERTYFTHPTDGPRMTYNSLALTGGSGDYPYASVPLGIPAPTSAPVVSVQTEGDTSYLPETRVYVFTFVSALGEEGPPSAPSNLQDIYPLGGVMRLSDLPTTVPAAYSGHITAKRIYRTLSGSATTDYQFVDEIPLAQATYDDDTPGEQLGETIPSTMWYPPVSGAFGITQMANGIMLLFKGYDIYPSEAYVPSAYPPGYSLAVDYPIVGAAAVGTTAIILTTGHPYLLTGSDPSAMSLVKLEDPQSCASKRSIAAVQGGVMYASPDGMMFVSVSGQTTNVTANMFTREEWQRLVPSSIHGYFHDGRYYGFYDTGSVQKGFILDPTQGAAAFTELDLYATAGYSDLVQDALYLKVGTTIVKWNSGAGKLSYEWKSGVIEMPRPSNPACAQVIAKAYPVTFNLYADGALKYTYSVPSSDVFRLPSGYRARFLEVSFAGTGEVISAALADGVDEMAAS